MRFLQLLLFGGCGIGVLGEAWAQVDPDKRQLVEFGYNQSFQGSAPIAAYAYYYVNLPDWPREGQTLRVAVAPVYLDAELAFREALGPNTHLALGLAGGGFADSYSEVRGGKYLKEESFTGNGGELSGSLYHLFNPGALIPLNGIVRAAVHYTDYEESNRTAPAFATPPDSTSLRVRTGLRWGGREPLLTPRAAMELSTWYEGDFTVNSGRYGFAGDRAARPQSHLFWSRALLAYTLPESEHYFAVSLTAGTSIGSDRLTGYKLGAVLPLGAEFPLSVPGYYAQELHARQFALLGGLYTVPLDAAKHWHLSTFAATAIVDYTPGMAQPGDWHSGLGGGLGYTSADKVWEINVGYAYGVDAIRSDGRGAHTIGLTLQYDLEARRTQHKSADPEVSPEKSRGLQRLFRGVFGN